MPLTKEIVHFTHNDLDAIGCMLNLEYKFPNIKKTTFHTNYRDLNEKMHEIIDYIHKNCVKLLVISDISFSDYKSELLYIQEEIQDKLNIKVLFYDHHVYPDNYFDGITIPYIHDMKKSATALVHDAFNNKDEHLDKLSNLINNYDIWVDSAPTFKISICLNEYFWNEFNNSSMQSIVDKIINNNYKLPEDFIEFYKDYQIKSKEKIENLKQTNLYMSDGYTAAIFTDTYISDCLYDSFNINSNKVTLIVNSYGIIRIRFSIHDMNDNVKKDIKKACIGTLAKGHLNAFSIKVENSNFNKLMDKVQELILIINKLK